MSQSSTEEQLRRDGPPAAAPAGPPAVPERRARSLWPVLLSLAVLGAIVWYTYEPGALGQMWAALHPGYLVLAVVFLLLRVWFAAVKMKFIAQGQIRIGMAARGVLVWDFTSSITPSAVGGAPFAAYYLARNRSMPFGEATAVMLFSALLDQFWFTAMVPLLLAASWFVDVYPATLGSFGAGFMSAVFVGMLIWAGLFTYFTLIRPDLLERLAVRLFSLRGLRRFRARVTREIDGLEEQSRIIRRQPPGFFLVGFLLSAGTWISRYLLLLFIVLSVHPTVPVLQFLARTVALLTLALVVPTPGGSGGVEGMYILFLGPLMPKALVGPTLLTWRLLAYYLFIAAGVWLTTQRSREQAATGPADEGKHGEGGVED